MSAKPSLSFVAFKRYLLFLSGSTGAAALYHEDSLECERGTCVQWSKNRYVWREYYIREGTARRFHEKCDGAWASTPGSVLGEPRTAPKASHSSLPVVSVLYTCPCLLSAVTPARFLTQCPQTDEEFQDTSNSFIPCVSSTSTNSSAMLS